MKLLSLNVSIFDANNEKLISFLKKINPDIVCLQEVSKKIEDSAIDAFISKDAIDRATTHLPYSFFSPNWALKDFEINNFHGKSFFQHNFGGFIDLGNYIRSRFKLVKKKRFFVQGGYFSFTDWKWNEEHQGEEPRSAQFVDLDINDQNVRILNYHGIWSRDKKDTERTIGASKKLLDLVSETNYPTIICGDFNLFPDTVSMRILSDKFSSLVDKFNIQSTRPKSNEHNNKGKRNVVDYILVSKEIEVKSFDVIESDVSDHLPLVLEFNIN